jgi:uncharacterized protein
MPLCVDNRWTRSVLRNSHQLGSEVAVKKIDVVAAVLLVIGGLNWGLVGAAGIDAVSTLFGVMSPLARTVYVLVGLAGLYQAVQWQGIQRRWLAPARAARA